MFDLFILAGMMMGFMMSSYLLWQQWQTLGSLDEVGASIGLLKQLEPRERSSPSVSREEFENQYILAMQKGGSHSNQDTDEEELTEVEIIETDYIELESTVEESNDEFAVEAELITEEHSSTEETGATEDADTGEELIEPTVEEETESTYENNFDHIKPIQVSQVSDFERRDALEEESVVSESVDLNNNKFLSLPGRGSNMVNVNQVPEGIELIKVPVVIGENTTQQMLVTDLELNFCAQKVRDVDASIRELTTTVITDKVIVQGILHKQIFYVDEENVVRHQPEDIPFSFFVDVPGALPGMDVQVHPEIEHIRTELLMGGCVLHQKVVIEFFVKVTDIQQIFVNIGEGILTKVERVVGENTRQILVPSEVELPFPAVKIVDIDARVEDITCEVIEDKVIIQGIVHKQVYYISQGDEIERHLAEDIPFSTFIDVPGAEPGNNCQVHPEIEFIKRELFEDGTILEQEVVLEIFVKITESEQLELVTGPGVLLKVPRVIGENTRQILLENQVQLQVPAIKIKEIEASVRNVTYTVIEDKIVIQGIVHKQIYFVDEDNIERHLGEDVPFSTFLDIPGATPGMDADINPIIEFVKPELTPPSDLLTQKVVVQFFVKITEDAQIEVPVVSPYL